VSPGRMTRAVGSSGLVNKFETGADVDTFEDDPEAAGSMIFNDEYKGTSTNNLRNE